MTDRALMNCGAAVLLVAGTIGALVGPKSPIAAIVVLPVLVVVPGGMIVRLLGIRSSSIGAWLMYSAATTTALLIPIGFVLNAIPSGLTTRTWNLALVVVVALLVVGTEAKQSLARVAGPDRQLWSWGMGSIQRMRRSPPGGDGPARIWGIVSLRRVLLIGLTVLCLVGAGLVSDVSATAHRESFTVLYGSNSGLDVMIGIRSYEALPLTYELTIGTGPGVSESFTLQPGGKRVITVPTSDVDENPFLPVIVRLYRFGDGTVYRSLQLYGKSL
jgi:hypothetical protein